MKKLKTKAFSVIFIILSAFTISILIIINIQEYNIELEKTEDILKSSNVFKAQDSTNDPTLMRFFDSNVYSVLLDDNNNISVIISHSKEDEVPNIIKEEVNKILNSNDKEYRKLI